MTRTNRTVALLALLLLFSLYSFAQSTTVYDAAGIKFTFPTVDWYVDGEAPSMHGVLMQAGMFYFDSYTTEPGLEKSIDAFTKLSRTAKGYCCNQRVPFKTKSGLEGYRTVYIITWSDGRSFAFTQYWFQLDEHVIVSLVFTSPAGLAEIYRPAFDRIAETGHK